MRGPSRPTAPPPSDSKEELVLLVSGQDGARVHSVPSEGTIFLGREPPCEVVLEDDSVSRRHAALHLGQESTLEDLGSTNGTRILGQRLATSTRTPLRIGIVAELGSTAIVLQRRTLDLSRALPAVAPSVLSPPFGPKSSPLRSPPADPGMGKIYEMLSLIGSSARPVLFLGETGTGKEVLAAEAHARSTRSSRPFLKVNAAALSETLLESELFGHENGSFTGATASKVGLFEAASGGTILLDEVGELPMKTQAKLLRVLESGEILRVGSVTATHIDVRFLFATNKDLQAPVDAGTFREDLFFRISGFVLDVPPLRHRAADIVPLAHFFLSGAAKRASRATPLLSAGAQQRLQNHTWPGNVRELKFVIERSFVLSGGREQLDVEHILLNERARVDTFSASENETRPAAMTLRDRIGDHERRRVIDALAECHHNQTHAAKLLGVSRGTLINKMKHHRLPPYEGREK